MVSDINVFTINYGFWLVHINEQVKTNLIKQNNMSHYFKCSEVSLLFVLCGRLDELLLVVFYMGPCSTRS